MTLFKQALRCRWCSRSLLSLFGKRRIQPQSRSGRFLIHVDLDASSTQTLYFPRTRCWTLVPLVFVFSHFQEVWSIGTCFKERWLIVLFIPARICRALKGFWNHMYIGCRGFSIYWFRSLFFFSLASCFQVFGGDHISRVKAKCFKTPSLTNVPLNVM